MSWLLAIDSPVINKIDDDATYLQKQKLFSKIYVLDKKHYPEKSDDKTQVLKIMFNGC
jgi:hypothetical protein